jgi:drug/metabolite transporter (DMT)-like permease
MVEDDTADTLNLDAFALTGAALVCFAANSLFARAALRGMEIDPASYTAIRLASGAMVLALIVAIRRVPPAERRSGSWASAAALFIYAAPFSFAYVTLATGTGALILFGVVQLTLITAGIVRGVWPTLLEWIGLVVAFAGLVWLTLPGVAAPDPLSALLMATAGVAWGLYTLRGKGAANPLAATADNFLRSVVMAAALMIVAMSGARATLEGTLLACASGAIASGLGYSIWYAALRHLTPARAGIVQLGVPVLTAIAGVLVLDEAMTSRLVVAGIAIVGGIAIAIAGRARIVAEQNPANSTRRSVYSARR